MTRLTDVEFNLMHFAANKFQIHRGRFLSGPDSDDWGVLNELCAKGLMERHGDAKNSRPGMKVFTITIYGYDTMKDYIP